MSITEKKPCKSCSTERPEKNVASPAANLKFRGFSFCPYCGRELVKEEKPDN